MILNRIEVIKTNLKRFNRIFLFSSVVGSTITMTVLIWYSFVFDASWEATIKFNRYGEQWIELIALTYTSFCLILLFIKSWRKQSKIKEWMFE